MKKIIHAWSGMDGVTLLFDDGTTLFISMKDLQKHYIWKKNEKNND